MNYLDKLNEALEFYEKEHLNFYFFKTKEEVNNFINEYLNNNPLNSDKDFKNLIRSILKFTLNEYDSHTKIGAGSYKRSGIQIQIFNKTPYVTYTNEAFENVKYAKLISIDGIPYKDILSEIEKLTCYSTEEYLEVTVEGFFNGSGLSALPSIDENKTRVFEFEKDNKIITVEYDDSKEYDVIRPGYKPNYSYEIYDDTLILVYNACKENKENEMLDTVNKIKEEVTNKGIKNFVLDLRDNGGGNSEIIKPLINYLKESDLKIATLVNKYIFSSGRWAIDAMKTTNTVFIGTDISTSMNAFGNIANKHELQLKDSKANLRAASKYFYIGDNNHLCSITSKKELDELPKDKFKLILFHPDIYVKESIEDIINNKDPYIEAVTKYFKQ